MTQLLQPIPSTAGLYAADATGQVWRLKGYGVRTTRWLKGSLNEDGYRRVKITFGEGIKSKFVHRLVAEAFHGKCPEGHEVCHANHVRDDNRPENLRYGTHAENIRESVRDGRWPKTYEIKRKLKEHQILEIIARYAGGAYQEDIAEEYGVTQGLVSYIIRTRFPR
jgi:hypothetical protein